MGFGKISSNAQPVTGSRDGSHVDSFYDVKKKNSSHNLKSWRRDIGFPLKPKIKGTAFISAGWT